MLINKLTGNNIIQNLPRSIDAFICSASFESRCLSVADNLKGYYFKKVFIAENKNLGNVTFLVETDRVS